MVSADPAHKMNVWAWHRAPHLCRAHTRSSEAIGVTLDFDAQTIHIRCSDGADIARPFPWRFELENVR